MTISSVNMMVDPHVTIVMGINITGDEIFDEVNMGDMGVEPPINSFDVKKLSANKIKNNYLARIANMIVDKYVIVFDPWEFISSFIM